MHGVCASTHSWEHYSSQCTYGQTALRTLHSCGLYSCRVCPRWLTVVNICISIWFCSHKCLWSCCLIQIKPLCVGKKRTWTRTWIFHYSAFSSWRTVIHPIRCRHNIAWLKQMITPQKHYPGKQAVHKLHRLTCSTQRKMMEFNGIMRNMKS